jgi:tetratricopeptide (TPR) repeat protein
MRCTYIVCIKNKYNIKMDISKQVDKLIIQKDYPKLLELANDGLLKPQSDDLRIIFLDAKVSALIGLENYDEAKALIEECLELNPNHSKSLFHLSIIADKKGELEKALILLDKAIEIKPSVAYLYNKANILGLSLGRYEEALETINKSIELNKSPLQFKLKVTILRKLKRYQEAIDTLNIVSNLHQDYIEAYKIKAIMYFKMRRYDMCLQQVNKIIEICPDSKVLSYREMITELALKHKQ